MSNTVLFLQFARRFLELEVADRACVCLDAGVEAFDHVHSHLSGVDRVYAVGDVVDAVVGTASPQLVLSVSDLLQSGLGFAD